MTGVEMTLWLNGSYLPLSQACISPLDRGLLFGDGLFTTMRAQEGRSLFLREHLERLAASARALNLPPDLGLPPGLEWPEIMAGLLARNDLSRGAARIKLLLTRGPAHGLGLPEARRPTLLALAEPYDPPSQEQYATGWRLHVCRQGHAPPLAGHKTLNYLYHLLARQEAQDAGYQEAVTLGPAGELCETAAGSLLVKSGGQWWTPESAYRLPGVTLAQTRRILAGWGLEVSQRPARAEDLQAAEAAWVLGSLMGVMPVAEVAGTPLPGLEAGLAARVRQALFSPG